VRISSLVLNETQYPFNDGLPDQNMYKLSKVVLLTGPNGSGKSRILRRIPSIVSEVYSSLKLFQLVSFECDLPPEDRAKELLGSYSYRNLGLQNPLQVSPAHLKQVAGDITKFGMQSSHNFGMYIQNLQNMNWEVTHPNYTESQDSRESIEVKYRELNDIIASMLGARLSRNADGMATLFGRPIADGSLSDGQLHLLAWATSLHAQGLKLGENVLTIDEPEIHLHPDAALYAIRKLIDANSQGQIWIATHCLPLIAGLLATHNDDTTLLTMNSGKASFAGREPEKVITSLMGGEENIHAVREFLDLPDVLAANRFAAECLLPATIVAGARTDDPQVVVIDTLLKRAESRPVKVLDYGAGDGRLVESLFAIHGQLDSQIDYVAWDIPESKGERCELALKRAYQTEKNRRFTDRDRLRSTHSQDSFDAVIMCNVLHEIEPSKWLEFSEPAGLLRQYLSPSGKLIIVEDYQMPKGEHAHRYGFIVLNTESLKTLFADTKNEIAVVEANDKYKDRIRAHSVPASLLANVTSATRKQALEIAQSKAKSEIQRLREEPTRSFKSGQSHAFWVQQFANTSLALSEL
jgi:energy-coupling factor transporter ATP-binding protein EcfA2